MRDQSRPILYKNTRKFVLNLHIHSNNKIFKILVFYLYVGILLINIFVIEYGILEYIQLYIIYVVIIYKISFGSLLRPGSFFWLEEVGKRCSQIFRHEDWIKKDTFVIFLKLIFYRRWLWTFLLRVLWSSCQLWKYKVSCPRTQYLIIANTT